MCSQRAVKESYGGLKFQLFVATSRFHCHRSNEEKNHDSRFLSWIVFFYVTIHDETITN